MQAAQRSAAGESPMGSAPWRTCLSSSASPSHALGLWSGFFFFFFFLLLSS